MQGPTGEGVNVVLIRKQLFFVVVVVHVRPVVRSRGSFQLGHLLIILTAAPAADG